MGLILHCLETVLLMLERICNTNCKHTSPTMAYRALMKLMCLKLWICLLIRIPRTSWDKTCSFYPVVKPKNRIKPRSLFPANCLITNHMCSSKKWTSNLNRSLVINQCCTCKSLLPQSRIWQLTVMLRLAALRITHTRWVLRSMVAEVIDWLKLRILIKGNLVSSWMLYGRIQTTSKAIKFNNKCLIKLYNMPIWLWAKLILQYMEWA